MAKTGLSARDKKLIYGCSLFAAAALTYMIGIAPLNTRIAELIEERDSARTYKSDVQYEAAMADMYDTDLIEKKALYIEDRAIFEDVYATENADRIFTEEVLKNDMTPLSFHISARNYDKRLSPYGYDRGTEAPDYSEYICLRSISFTCTGTFERALKFVDELKDRKGVLINSVSFVNNDGEYSDVNSRVTLSVTFDIYTYDKEGFTAAYAIETG